MTEMYLNIAQFAAAGKNAFGKTGMLDRFGNVLGFVLVAFGVIFLIFSAKVKKMGGFYLEMENHDPVIKDLGYLPGEAKVGEHRSSEIAGKTFSEMQLLFELDGEVYEKWTPDLGSEGTVKIEYNPKNPNEFYILDKVDEESAPDTDEDGKEQEELKEPPNKVFIAMLVFGIAILGLGCGFLYDFYFIK